MSAFSSCSTCGFPSLVLCLILYFSFWPCVLHFCGGSKSKGSSVFRHLRDIPWDTWRTLGLLKYTDLCWNAIKCRLLGRNFSGTQNSCFTEAVTLYSSYKSLEHCDHLRVGSCKQITDKTPYHTSISRPFGLSIYMNDKTTLKIINVTVIL